MRFVLGCALALSLVGSGCDGTNSRGTDSGRSDAAPPGGATGNALGQSCTAPEDCPAEPAHTCVFLQSGNPALGYCSPSCADDAECAEGYTGPVGGAPTCFVPGVEAACSILCGTTADCPGELECKVTGGPVNVCATR